MQASAASAAREMRRTASAPAWQRKRAARGGRRGGPGTHPLWRAFALRAATPLNRAPRAKLRHRRRPAPPTRPDERTRPGYARSRRASRRMGAQAARARLPRAGAKFALRSAAAPFPRRPPHAHAGVLPRPRPRGVRAGRSSAHAWPRPLKGRLLSGNESERGPRWASCLGSLRPAVRDCPERAYEQAAWLVGALATLRRPFSARPCDTHGRRTTTPHPGVRRDLQAPLSSPDGPEAAGRRSAALVVRQSKGRATRTRTRATRAAWRRPASGASRGRPPGWLARTAAGSWQQRRARARRPHSAPRRTRPGACT